MKEIIKPIQSPTTIQHRDSPRKGKEEGHLKHLVLIEPGRKKPKMSMVPYDDPRRTIVPNSYHISQFYG